MHKPIILLSLVAGVACAQNAATAHAETAKPSEGAATSPAAKASQPGATLHGTALTMKVEEAVKLADIVAKPTDFDGKTVIVDGAFVKKACSKKGCWMEIADAKEGEASSCRVTFKDYGFFVPLDAAGSVARLQGTVGLRTVSKEDVDHLEAEGAKFAVKNEDGSAKEVHIVATGVELAQQNVVN